MNVPKAAEIALAETLKKYVELAAGLAVRTWQNLQSTGNWNEKKDRTFPVIDIRCSPPRHDENQHTMECSQMLLCGTITSDDRDHQIVSEIYEGVQLLTDKLFFQFLTDPAEKPELDTYLAALTRQLGDDFSFGGLSYGEPLAPFDDNGVNMLGVNLLLHFARTDF